MPRGGARCGVPMPVCRCIGIKCSSVNMDVSVQSRPVVLTSMSYLHAVPEECAVNYQYDDTP